MNNLSIKAIEKENKRQRIKEALEAVINACRYARAEVGKLDVDSEFIDIELCYHLACTIELFKNWYTKQHVSDTN